MNFSTTLRLQDIDDFIAPAQTCVKPVKIATTSGTTKSIRIEEDGSYTATLESGEKQTLKKATITLNDCLACSGCITTAESVLITQHSSDVFLRKLQDNRSLEPCKRSIIVASISPQSVSNIAAQITDDNNNSSVTKHYRAWLNHNNYAEQLGNLDKTFHFVAYSLRKIGVHLIVDITPFRDIALKESANEFVSELNCTDSTYRLPIFCSVCPGWVCFAEKSYEVEVESASNDSGKARGYSLVSHLSKIRSPQQIAGSLLRLFTNGMQVYHVTVMPCFDKKLEASRKDFISDDNQPDVDLVLATNELIELLKEVYDNELSDSTDENDNSIENCLQLNMELTVTLKSLQHHFGNRCMLDNCPTNMYRHMGTGSGGYAAYVFYSAAKNVFGITLNNDPLSDQRVWVRTLRNIDMQEVLLFRTVVECEAAKALANKSRLPYRRLAMEPYPLLVFAIANGFRNIQTVVSFLKADYHTKYRGVLQSKLMKNKQIVKYPFDYVEVMACPSGCLNGGGQLRGSLQPVANGYFSLPSIMPLTTETAQSLYSAMDQIDPEHKCLRTQFHQVPKLEIVDPSVLRW